jgi:hypothetical protein
MLQLQTLEGNFGSGSLLKKKKKRESGVGYTQEFVVFWQREPFQLVCAVTVYTFFFDFPLLRIFPFYGCTADMKFA